LQYHKPQKMAPTSLFLNIFFSITVLLSIWLFMRAARFSRTAFLLICTLSIVQSALSLNGFYQNGQALPPRFIFLIGPGFLVIAFLFLSKKGRQFIDSLDIRWLTWLHIVRIPVEIVLYYVAIARLIPALMTFEGNNLDILSGISAPVIYYLVFVWKKANWKVLLIWNFVCLGLLINILVLAILSAPTPFQQLAFDQPNRGVSYFPFALLPAVIVPVVLLSQLAGIWQLVRKKDLF